MCRRGGEIVSECGEREESMRECGVRVLEREGE